MQLQAVCILNISAEICSQLEVQLLHAFNIFKGLKFRL